MRARASYLSVVEQFNLNHACRMLTAANFSVYQVGSSLERLDFRDVDLRAILDDEEFDALFAGQSDRLSLLNVALSEWLAARTRLHIDFQFQRRTDANAKFGGARNAVGFPLAWP